MIQHKCGKCGAILESPSSMVGQEEVCVECGATTIVPPSPGMTPPERAVPSPTVPPSAVSIDLGNNVAMKLVPIPVGEFMMGREDVASYYTGDEAPRHKVTIRRPFYMGMYAVTQEQYEQVMGKNPSNVKGAQNPVENVSWDDAVAFCRNFSAKTGKAVRLPTEAEWEYACRAGSKTQFSYGDDYADLAHYAWYRENSEGKTHPVGQKMPNAWGLYDMHGNVLEWCADWLGWYGCGKETNPTGPAAGSFRVLRGGSCCDDGWACRSAHRQGSSFHPSGKFPQIGFRVVRG
jgi:formylglycine-generating enzyme required for sulfatase activity